MKKVWIASALLAGGLFASQAQALEKGDKLFRIGATGVFPESTDSDDITAGGTPLAGNKVGPDDAWSLGLTLGYAITDNVVVELLAAWPFKHDIEPNGALKTTLGTLGVSTGNIGEIKQLPPTLNLQYYFTPKSNIRPYVGAGVTYFYTFDEKVKGGVAEAGFTKLKVDDAWGLGLQGGVDFDINDDWFATADLRWMSLEVDATISGAGGALDPIKANGIQVDPWVFSFMVGRTF